ncbi:MAG: outer membrane beta-barrel protein [Holosporaceae bacterium]|jgi:opacity protein-like surface antigen|nr:outer membrane beta-barrel protein [Holosporaceae bacterium]
MKKLFICSLFLVFNVFSSAKDSANSPETSAVANGASGDDFLELSEPHRTVSGAYWGMGVGIANIKHTLNATASGVSHSQSNSANQYDLALIAGFGSAFYKKYYAGIEFLLFKRLNKKTKFADGESIGLRHTSNVGFDMDVRIGLQLPESGNLIYGTIGLARVVGSVVFMRGDQIDNRYSVSFGSFYPTFGLGLEHKINDFWNIRGDLRISLTSKDDGKQCKTDRTWTFDAKPSKFSIRLSVTYSI